METGPFVDPAGARLRHAARLQRMQQLVNPTPAPAAEPAHGVDIARLATGTLGGALATSALMRLIPHPAAQVAGAAIPLAARVLPHAANLVGSIAGFAGAPALVDAVAPGLHDTVNKNLGTVGGAAAVALPLAMLAMRRGRGVTPVGGGAPVTPGGPALPGVGGPVPGPVPVGPAGTSIIRAPIQKIHPVPMEPQPLVPGPDLLTSLGVRGHLMGPAPHVPEVAPIPAAAVPVPISGHLPAPVRMPEIRNPLSGFASQATHLAPAPVPVDPVVRGHLPSPTLESRFGIPAEYDAILPAHISQMSPGQLSSIALQNNSRALQNVAGIVDANLASRSPGQLALNPFKKKIENSPELANPPAVVAEPTAAAPQIVRLSRRGPAEPTIRMPEIQDAIRQHGVESAAIEFNRAAKAARQPLLSPDEMRYLEVAAQKMAQSPAQHARVRSTTIKPNPEIEVPQLVDPENVAPVRQVFQGLQQERFEKLAQGIDRQLRAEQDPKRRLKIAKTAMIGEPRDVKNALRQHLEQIAPDVHGRLMKKSQLPAVQEPELPNVVADLASGELEDQLPGSAAGDQVLSPPPIGPVEFIPHRVARDGGFETVMADAGKLEDQWSQNPQNYLPKELPAEGEGATRFQKVNEFLKSGNAVEQPHVVVDAQGKLALDDGRHRARLLMNEGQPQIPLTVPTEDAAKVNSLVGVSPTVSGPVGVPHAVGDMVKLTVPGVNGPINVAGRVTQVLPSGQVEVKTQQHGYATMNPGDLQPHQPIQVSEQKGVSNAAGHVGEQIVGGDELQNGAGGGQATEAGPGDRAVGAGPGSGQAENHSPVTQTPAAEELNAHPMYLEDLTPEQRAALSVEAHSHMPSRERGDLKRIWQKTQDEYLNEIRGHLMPDKNRMTDEQIKAAKATAMRSLERGESTAQGIRIGRDVGGKYAVFSRGEKLNGGMTIQQARKYAKDQVEIALEPDQTEAMSRAKAATFHERNVKMAQEAGLPVPPNVLEKYRQSPQLSEHSALLAKAEPYRQYGENYNRHIATSADQLQSMIERGHTPSAIQYAAKELETRLGVHGKPAAAVQESVPQPAASVSRKPFEKAELSVKDAVDQGVISHEKDGRWYVGSGDKPYKTGPEAVEAYLAGRRQGQKDLDAQRLQKFDNSKLRAVRDGDNVTVEYPDGRSETMSMREYRQKVFDIEEKYGTDVTLVSKSELPSPKVVPSLDPHTFDYGVQRSMMDRNGRAEHGGISTKVVPHPAGGFGVEVNTPHPTQQGVSREGMPESYPTIEEAQSAAIKELAKRVGAKPEGGAAPTVAQAEPVKTEVATAEIPPYKRETPAASQNSAERQQRWEQISNIEQRLRDIEKRFNAKNQELGKIPRSHTKKRAAIEEEMEPMRIEAVKLRDQSRELTRRQDLELIEDQLQTPKSRAHFLKSMTELHDLKRRQYADMIDTTSKARALGRAETERIDKLAAHHQAESDKHALELIDQIKSQVPTDKLNKDEIQSVAEDVFRDFSHRSDLERSIPEAVQRRLGHRGQYGQTEIDKLTRLDEAAKNRFKDELKGAAERGPDWFEKSQEIIAKAKGENDTLAKAAAEKARLAAEESAREAEIAARNALKESRAKNREQLTEPRYFESVEERARGLKGKVEKITNGGSIAAQREGLLEREQIGSDWKVEKSLVKSPDGTLKPRYDLTHVSTGASMEVPNAKEARKFVVMLGDQGLELPKSMDAVSGDIKKKVSRITGAWDNEQLHGLNDEERAAALSKVSGAPSNLKADIVLGADDLGYGHEGKTHVVAAKINPKLKELAEEVPEFGYNPVLTATDRGTLVFRDGYRYEFPVENFNLHPSELKPGQTVGINLDDLGIKRPNEAQVVASMIKDAGFHNVTIAKSGAVTASYEASSPKITMTASANNPQEWSATGGPGAEEARKVLGEIRWKQPGQEEPQRSGAGVKIGKPTSYDDTTFHSGEPKAAAKIEKLSAKPTNMAGQTREKKEPTAARPIHERSMASFNIAFEDKHAEGLKNWLGTQNKGLRAEFEKRTGIKLPRTAKGTEEAIDAWVKGESGPKAAIEKLAPKAAPEPEPKPQIEKLSAKSNRSAQDEQVEASSEPTSTKYRNKAGDILIATPHDKGVFNTVVKKDGSLHPIGSQPVDESKWTRLSEASAEPPAMHARAREVFAEYKPILEKQVSREATPRKKAMAAVGVLDKIDPTAQQALVDHLKAFDPEAYRALHEYNQKSPHHAIGKTTAEPAAESGIEKLTAKAGPIVNPYGDSPAGKAYVAAKTQAPGSMVLLRNGDFYELFGDDAVKASKDVGLTLTHLDKNSKNPIPMAGFPYHHLEGYLQKLVRSGHRVAIAEAK